MVILYSKVGGFCNRLWQAAHFIANAKENNYRFIHLGFSEYVKFFNQNGSFNMSRKVYFNDYQNTSMENRLIIKYASYKMPFTKEFYFERWGNDNFESFNLSSADFVQDVKKRIVKVDGWGFIDGKSLDKHSDYIRKVFTPNKLSVAKDFIGGLSYDKIIGVHMRRGDYLKFNEGKYYFKDCDYKSFMLQCCNMYPNKNIGFFLCSDEKINYDNFFDFNICKPGFSGVIEDLYTLSYCDLIIGPPSTFSEWASFYGKTPAYHIQSKKETLHQDKFKIIGLL